MKCPDPQLYADLVYLDCLLHIQHHQPSCTKLITVGVFVSIMLFPLQTFLSVVDFFSLYNAYCHAKNLLLLKIWLLWYKAAVASLQLVQQYTVQASMSLSDACSCLCLMHLNIFV